MTNHQRAIVSEGLTRGPCTVSLSQKGFES